MTAQLPLTLTLHEAPRLDDFVAGPNQAVLAALRRALQPGGERQIHLSGPRGSGRSHLLMGQCAAAEAQGWRCAYLPLRERGTLAPAMLDGLETLDLVAVDDVDAIAGDPDWERALFDLYNRCRDRATALLISAERGPAALPIRLPDLRSRLAWGLALALQPLDDAGRIALLQALAERRAMQMPADVARFLLQRTSRHPSDLVETVAALDRASLAERRHLTVPFVKDCLGL